MDRTWREQSTRVVRAACLGFALLLALPLLLPQAGLPAGHAEEVGDDVAHSEDFNLGFGGARGTGVRVGPSRSGFNFTTDFAVSLADYQNTVARGDSRGVSLGTILETVAESFDEEGEYTPSNLRTDSRNEDAAEGVSREEFGGGEGPFGGAVGSQYVRATEAPFAEVETIMGVLGLEGAVELEGGSSRATAGIVDTDQRQARGEAAFERVVLGGGAVVLEGLKWEAVHRTGAEEGSVATFSLGGIEVQGEPVIPEEAGQQGADGLAEAMAAANEALAETGLRLEAPEQVVNEQTGQVEITPLKVSMGPSEGSKAIAGPISDGFQPIREPLAEGLIEAESSFGAVFLLYDVLFGAFAGGGEILLELGGARAVTGFQEFENPFGDFGGAIDGSFGEVPEPSSSQSSGSPELSSQSDAGGSQDLGGPSEASAPETSAPESDGPVDEPVTSEPPQEQAQEELAAPAGASGSRGGQALTAALVALLVAAGLGGADFLRLRQSQRTILT